MRLICVGVVASSAVRKAPAAAALALAIQRVFVHSLAQAHPERLGEDVVRR
eukprot:CAMPEP_0197433786 /NCGR_PEP_ID=MMETSP1175-20131217/1598_1 /TAXON_ID=1003142 /ORGANISM="Triceratium dubium, Strain CCMP147" /LENGTH=50 /DNA_ID=CAMNT_0042962271 /DNA_START=63 /DNA_END=211 /DNA_ORIENTATION=-